MAALFTRWSGQIDETPEDEVDDEYDCHACQDGELIDTADECDWCGCLGTDTGLHRYH